MEIPIKPSGRPHPSNRCKECKPSRAGWENTYEGCAECSQRDRIFDGIAKKGWEYWNAEHGGVAYWGLFKEDVMKVLTWTEHGWEYECEFLIRPVIDDGTKELLELSRKVR